MADEAPEPTEAPAHDQPEGGEGEGQPQGEHQQRIARQYANLRREKKAWQSEKSAWEKERDAGKGELSRLHDLRGKAPKNIGAWLQAGNITQQDLNAFLTRNTEQANDPTHQRISEETRRIQEKLASYEQQLQEMKNAQEKGRTIDKIKGLVDSKPDDFELIRHYEAHQDVAELMDLWLAEKGERISESEACAIIERTIEERDEEDVRRALATRKIAKRIGWKKPGESDDDPENQQGEDDETPVSDEPPAQQRKQPTRGKPKLTNASPSSGQRRPASQDALDPYDRDIAWRKHVAKHTRGTR